MKSLNEEALEALSAMSELEQRVCLSMVEHFKNLGLHQHASSAICALREADAVPVKQ